MFQKSLQQCFYTWLQLLSGETAT